MKNIFLLFSLLNIISSQLIYSQQSKIELLLKSKFENFEYEKVITISDSLLKFSGNLTREDSIKIFYYRAISAFHIWDINLSEESFKVLLKLDKNFQPDSSEVSPKIISFFNQIRKREIEEIQSISLQQNLLFQDQNSKVEELRKNFSLYREAILKNLVYPGWGNFVINQKTKAYIFTSSFSISLISSVYFYFLTEKKEREYLNEINPDKISEKYSPYNMAYKLRNISLISLGLIYIYSQFDLLTETFPLSLNNLSRIDLEQKNNSINLSIYFPIK